MRAILAGYEGALRVRYPTVVNPDRPKKPRRPRPASQVADAKWGVFWGDFEEKRARLLECAIPGFRMRGDPTRYKAYEKLVATAELLLDRKIPPGAWTLFSVDVWRVHLDHLGGKPPPLTWVYSENRVRERTEWFEEEAHHYRTPRVSCSPEHLALGHAWRQMQYDAIRSAPKTREELIVVVDRHFPGDRWEQMVEQARRANRAIQAAMDAAAARGEVW